MTREQILTRFPHATESTISRNLGDPGPGTSAQLQNRETRDIRDDGQRQGARPASDQPKASPVDATVHSRFEVRIALRFSDRRRRDPDGCASTILDCLVAARRLLDGDSNFNDHQ